MNKNLKPKILALREAGAFHRNTYYDVWNYFQKNKIFVNGKKYQPSLSSVKTYLSPSGVNRHNHELDKAYIEIINARQNQTADIETKNVKELDGLNQTVIKILERQKQIVSIERAIETLRIGLLKLNGKQLQKAMTHIKEINDMLERMENINK